MNEKLNLKFKIMIYKDEKSFYEVFNINRKYYENVTLNYILKGFYIEYSQDKRSDEDLNGFEHYSLIYEQNLFEINYKFVDIKLEPSIYNYMNIPIKFLEEQFTITKNIFEIWLDSGVGGDVGRCRGIHFFFHTNEKDLHHVPHIHCKCGEEEFRVNLNNLKIMDKEFKNRKRTKIALEIIKKNQKELIKYWNNVVVKGEMIKFKMYFPCN